MPFVSCEKVSGCQSYDSLDLEVKSICFAVIFVNRSTISVSLFILVYSFFFILRIYTLFSMYALFFALCAISANQKQEEGIFFATYALCNLGKS